MKDLSTYAQDYHERCCALGGFDRIRRDSHAGYLRRFVLWLGRHGGITRPDQLSSEEIGAWHRYVASRPSARTGLPQLPGSIYTDVRTVYRFCRALHKEGLISEAVMEGFPPMRPPPRSLQIGLRHEVVRHYLDHLPMNTPGDFLFRALAEFFYSTGVRAKEALGIDLANVNFEERSVKVLGKGRKERIVPIGRTAMKHLEIYLAGVRPRLLHKANETAFWLNQRGSRIEYPALREWFAARDTDGLRVRPHVLRRACATELLRSGASPWIVKELLGHDDLQTIEHYALLDLADMQEMHARCHPRDRASFGKLEPRTLE